MRHDEEAGAGFAAALAVWHEAARFDPTIAPGDRCRAWQRRSWTPPTRYSRARLFAAMSEGEPALFVDFPIDPRTRAPGAIESLVLPAIRHGFPARKRARVRAHGRVRNRAIGDVLDGWVRGSSRFGVTDLHYPGTAFDRRIDTRALNEWNLLPRGAEGFQSQDSLVISSRGAVTDSHSDDHSGSNHCFVGVKIWLLWETLEGLRHGLQDGTHCAVTERADFDVAAFRRLKSARWLVISAGQTMFIPAHLSHKVITVEKYIGLGSFHAAFPGVPDLLRRWQALAPQWTRGSGLDRRCTVEHLLRRATRKLELLANADADERARWGVPDLLEQLRADRTALADGGEGSSVPAMPLAGLRRAAARAAIRPARRASRSA